MPLERDNPPKWFVYFFDRVDGVEKHPPSYATQEEAMRCAFAYYGQPNTELLYVRSSDGQLISLDEMLRFNSEQR
jgi:hypothetical protein